MLEKTGRFKQGPTYNIRNNEANKKSVPVRYYNLNELNENETPLPKCVNLCGINSICCTVSIVAIPNDLGCFFRNTSCLATYFRSQENSAFRIRDSLIAVTLHFRKVILWPHRGSRRSYKRITRVHFGKLPGQTALARWSSSSGHLNAQLPRCLYV